MYNQSWNQNYMQTYPQNSWNRIVYNNQPPEKPSDSSKIVIFLIILVISLIIAYNYHQVDITRERKPESKDGICGATDSINDENERMREKARCFTWYAIEKDYPDYCDFTDNEEPPKNYRDKCYLNYAIAKNKISACESIVDDNINNICINLLKEGASYCGQLPDYRLQQICSRVAEMYGIT